MPSAVRRNGAGQGGRSMRKKTMTGRRYSPLICLAVALICGCATVKDNPPPQYPPLAQSLYSFLQAPKDGRYTVSADRLKFGRGYGNYVLIVSNQTVRLQPLPERMIDHNWQFHYPPSSYRARILTQDQIQNLSACQTRDEVIAVLGQPDEEAPDFLPLLPPFGGQPIGINSHSTQNMYYRWFSVTETDHVITTGIQIGLSRTNGAWHVRSLMWNMEGYGASNHTSEGIRRPADGSPKPSM